MLSVSPKDDCVNIFLFAKIFRWLNNATTPVFRLLPILRHEVAILVIGVLWQ